MLLEISSEEEPAAGRLGAGAASGEQAENMARAHVQNPKDADAN